MQEWIKGAHKIEVQVAIPKFKMSGGGSLNRVLRASGMTDAFDLSRADFSGINGKPHSLCVSALLHQASIEVGLPRPGEAGSGGAAGAGRLKYGRSWRGRRVVGAGCAWRRAGYDVAAMSGIDCIAALKALGELSRLRIVRLLLKERLGVNALSERLGMSQYNVSKHLRILREAGLVEMEKQGQQRLYSVVPGLKSQLAANKNVLELGCCTFRFDKLPK